MKSSSIIVKNLVIFVFFLLLMFCHSVLAQQEKATPPNSIIAEGLPSIPKSLQDDFKQSTKRKAASFIGWNSDGSAVGYSQYYEPFIMKSPMGERVDYEITLNDPDNILLQPKLEKSFLFTKDTEGNENTQLYQYFFDSKSTIQLTNSPQTILVNSYLWSEDGNSIYFLNRKKKESAAEIYFLNPQTKESKKLLTLEGDAYYLVALNDSFLVFAHYLANNDIKYQLLNLKSTEVIPLTTESAYVAGAKFSRANNGILWLSDKEGNYLNLYFYDLNNKTTKKLSVAEQNIRDFCISPDEKLIALKLNDSGVDIIDIYELNGFQIGKEVAKPKIPVGVVDKISWRNNEELGFSFESQKNPPEIRSLNIKTNEIKVWAKGDANPALVNNLQDTQVIRWKSFDNREITGLLLSPKIRAPEKKFPVLIDIHGGPKEEYQPYFNSYRLYAAKIGIAIIYPNIRGSSGFGKDFEDLDNKEKRVNAVKDLQALLDWIGTQPQLDSTKIIVRGGSYGGFMALALGMKEPDRLKGVIAEAPPVSIKNYIAKSSKSLQEIYESEFGSMNDSNLMTQNETLSLLTPNNLDHWKLPVLLTVGKNDVRVPVEDIEKLKNLLKAQGTQVWFLKATNEGHFWGDYDNNIFLEITKIMFITNSFK